MFSTDNRAIVPLDLPKLFCTDTNINLSLIFKPLENTSLEKLNHQLYITRHNQTRLIQSLLISLYWYFNNSKAPQPLVLRTDLQWTRMNLQKQQHVYLLAFVLLKLKSTEFNPTHGKSHTYLSLKEVVHFLPLKYLKIFTFSTYDVTE